MSAGRVWIDEAFVAEGNAGTKVVTFTVRRVGGADAFDVGYATSDGDARVADGDYVAASGVLHFDAGVESRTISVTVNGDTKFELDEIFSMTLSGATNGALIDKGYAFGVIMNDDRASGAGNVWIDTAAVVEGDSGKKLMTYTVTRAGGTAAFSVDYSTWGNSATAGQDFVQKSGTLQFAAGETSKTITIEVNGDTAVEGDEYLYVNLSGATGGAKIVGPFGAGSGRGTILDNDTPAGWPGYVSLDGPSSVTEGNAGTKVVTFTVTRTGGTGAFSVNYSTSDFYTATAGQDYVAASGTLQFAAGVNSQTISVTIKGDTLPEIDEFFTIGLWGPTNGATIVNGGGGMVTIVNDDGAPAGIISISDVSIVEGNSGTQVMTFTVTRRGGIAAFNVDYSTGFSFDDFTSTSGTLQFGVGVMTRTFSVTIKGDTNVEANESFLVQLSNPTNNAVFEANAASGTIINDDGLAGRGQVRIDNVSIVEGNSGTKLMTFTVLRSGGADAFSVNYDTVDLSASVAEGDYQATAGILQFGVGVMSQTFTVAVNGDTAVEDDEMFGIKLTNATNGAIIYNDLAIGRIVSDDVAGAGPIVSIGNASIVEGNSGTAVLTFTVTRTGGSGAFSVNYATSDGGATVADSDYVAASGTLQFAAGVDSQTISATIKGDTKPEANQSFFVILSAPTNGAVLGTSFAVGTILNDEPTVLVDTGAKLGAMTPEQLAALTGQGITRIDASDNKLVLNTVQLAGLGSVSLTSADDVTLKDTGANLAGVSDVVLAGLAAKGVDRIDVSDGALSLGMAKAVSLSVPILVADTVTVRDTGQAIAMTTASAIAALAGKGIDSLDATDDALFLGVDQYRALGTVKLTGADAVTLLVSQASLATLTPNEVAGLAKKGIDRISETLAGHLDLTVAQYKALGTVTFDPGNDVSLRDTGAAIAGLSAGQVAALGKKGIDWLDATDGAMSLTVAQYKVLGAVQAVGDDLVTLADKGAALGALSAVQIDALDDKGIDRLDATDDKLSLTVAQFRALGDVGLVSNDVVTLADHGDRIATLTPDEIVALRLKGFDRIDATNNLLALSRAQYEALGTVALTPGDVVTLKDTGANLAGLSAVAMGALAGKGVDALDAGNNTLSLSLAQFAALGAVTVATNDALTVTGTSGNDTFTFAKRLLAATDRVVGGDGSDTLMLAGNYAAGLTFQAATITGIEKFSFKSGESYNLKLHDGNVAAGQTLAVNGATVGALGSLIFDGSAETNGKFAFTGGAGASTFTGGKLADAFTGGTGQETIRYTAAAQSSGPTYDTVAGFNAAVDRFDLWKSVTAVDTPITQGSLSSATFDANLAVAMTSLAAGHAVLFTANGGTLAGATFLVVDTNGVAGYQAGADLAVRLNQATNLGSFGTSTFV